MIIRLSDQYSVVKRPVWFVIQLDWQNFSIKYLSFIQEKPFKYHMVLTIKNPNETNLKESINRMYKFFDQSSIKRNLEFNNSNKKYYLLEVLKQHLINSLIHIIFIFIVY